MAKLQETGSLCSLKSVPGVATSGAPALQYIRIRRSTPPISRHTGVDILVKRGYADAGAIETQVSRATEEKLYTILYRPGSSIEASDVTALIIRRKADRSSRSQRHHKRATVVKTISTNRDDAEGAVQSGRS